MQISASSLSNLDYPPKGDYLFSAINNNEAQGTVQFEEMNERP